jgi:hypothetical protein
MLKFRLQVVPNASEDPTTNRGRASQAKRRREIARQEKARDKAADRVTRRDTPRATREHPGGEDPDIAGIRPGPQPLPEEFADLRDLGDLNPEEGEEGAEEKEEA